MKTIERLSLLLLTFTLSGTLAFAQRDEDAAAGAACGIFACGMFFYFLMIAVMIGISITIIVLIYKFIKKDAISRGMPNASAMPWLALAGLMGLLIYVLIRPQGNVMPCPSCGQQRMQGLQTCPQCGRP
jgi:hypothetical protein